MIDHHPLPETRRLSSTPHASPRVASGIRVGHVLSRWPAHADQSTLAIVLREVMATRRAEQALAMERQRRADFVSQLAHELRQPLSALLMAVEVVRLEPERAAEIMKRQIGQMNRLIEDLMDLRRGGRGAK